MFENVLANISRSVQLTEAEQQRFVEFLKPVTIKKKTNLLRAGEVCMFEAYVQQGCIRTYYLDEKGSEVTLSFAVEDWWVSDIASFHDQSPSDLYIETLEDSTLFVLSRENKEQLLQEIPRLERVFRLLVQRRLSALQNRLVKALSLPAKQRYMEFLEQYPMIPARVPQYYIASYLGVSPEFVSNIRRKLASQ